MIINKPLEVNDVVTIKLTSGEELIAKLVNTAGSEWTVSNPYAVVMTTQGPGLQHWLVTADAKNIRIPKDKVMALELTIKDYKTQYIKITTGIELV
jgi:hypothetical protein